MINPPQTHHSPVQISAPRVSGNVIFRKMDFSHENFKGRKDHIVSSAPGKVLVCGGYVVLNGFASLVLTTRARFYSVVGLTESVPKHHIRVESPQFGKIYNYEYKDGNFRFGFWASVNEFFIIERIFIFQI
jgi:phosphomevalonate kinase